MIPISRNLSLLVACVLFIHGLVSAQTHPKEAEENPLSTVIYLLSTTDKDDDVEEKACLAKSLGRADRFSEINRAINMVKESSYVDQDFAVVVLELIARGKEKEASTLVSFLVQRFGSNDYRLEMLIKPMIMLKRDAELESLIEKFEDSEKIDLWFKSADVYRELGNAEKALDHVQRTVNIARASRYAEDRAELALHYAALGRESESLEFIQLAMRDLAWKSGKPEYTEGRVLDRCVDAYKLLGKRAEAAELLRRQGKDDNEAEDRVENAKRYTVEGDRRKAIESLDRAVGLLDPQQHWDAIDLGDVVESYLKLHEVEKAFVVAKTLDDERHVQQEALLRIADYYVKASNRSRAHEILRFALEQTRRIDTSEPENGNLWTSGKWNQARYQSQIAIRYMDLKADNEALRLTAQLKKPYLRALILTEYVAINKNRMSAKKLAPYLEEAIGLLRRKKVDIFDSKRFDVFAIVARSFAEIGMTQRSNEIFAEALSTLDKAMGKDGTDSGILFAMCNIGVDFEKSKIKADENVKAALRSIIKNWESDEY